ncbi:MAG: SRPBCC family protein [Flavobacteriales bacterium]|nr:SRPBCC family protein [Flavobacteriales bacterium]MCB9335113.1 SRPBCC family protein [Flavobacteriales bacterium]
MKINTSPKTVKANAETIYNFLFDINNFQELFPAEKIENWNSTEETCTFRIKGMTDIGLKRVASTPHSLIYLDSYGKVPFKFTLNIFLNEKNENETDAHLEFDGEVNPFLKMMVESPLTNFFNMLADKLVEKFN